MIPRHKPVFRGPHEVREVWFALAERQGAGGADRILGERPRMSPRSVAYRRRTGMWYGMIPKGALAELEGNGRR